MASAYPRYIPPRYLPWHLLFWVAAGLYACLVYYLYRGPVFALGVLLIDLPLQIILAYAYLKWVVPLWRKGRFAQFFAWTIGALAAIIIVGRCLFYLYAAAFMPEVLATRNLFSAKELIGAPFDYMNIPALFVLINTLQTSYRISLQNERLLLGQKEAALKILKAQINPHFLFNTLNNLYGLTLAKADAAPHSVMQLSRIMEYMLYESSKDTVPLGSEIDYLENYIALEHLRCGHRLSLQFNKEINPAKNDVSIAPLLLLPFVENAFKHGVAKWDGQAWVKIMLDVDIHHLYYSVENSTGTPVQGSGREGSGGLQILRQRMDLMYGKAYSMETVQREGSFYASLKLPI